MKHFQISAIITFFMASPLFGQSIDEKRFAFRSALVVNALTYNLDKKNAIGLHFGQIPATEISIDNVDTLEKKFYGFNYAYAFNCINCNSYFLVTILNSGNSIVKTVDGSAYTYSELGLSIIGGYTWYFKNNISVLLGTGPAYSNERKENEDIKSENDYGKDADERMEKLRFLPLVPFILVGYSF